MGASLGGCTLAAMAETLILLAHPQLRHSRVHARLQRELVDQPGLALHDLYAHYPEYWIDVPAEQARVTAARHLVWMHPIHWYGMPPLMKLWVDQVLTQGWAYGRDGRALAGKRLTLVLSTGGAASAYSEAGHHGHPFETFLLPYQQIARFTGLEWQPPWVFHDAHRASDAALAAHALALRQHLQQER